MNISDKITHIKEFLLNMGFKHMNGRDKHYLTINKNNYRINVIYPFNNPINKIQKNGKINWGRNITIGAETSSAFNHPESLDQLFWVVYLLKCGYNPNNIYVETKWQTGHSNSGGRIDILITKRGKAWCVLDAKTRGYQYHKYTDALINMRPNNQVASYYGYSTKYIKYVGTVTTDFINNQIHPVSYITSTRFWTYLNGKVIINDKSKLPLDKAFRFNPSVIPYTSFKIKKITDLTKISDSSESRGILNEFAELIRRNGISDKANAYNKILNLFIAKIYDEYCASHKPERHGELKFLNNRNDSDSAFMNNLISLYDDGMKHLIGIKSNKNKYMNILKSTLDKSNEITGSVAKVILSDVRNIRTHSDSTFLFEPVYDDKTYKNNIRVVRKAVDFLAPYKFVDPHKEEFLGDFFENILKNGFEQESGQFFTPIPIGKYIMHSLPLDCMLRHTINSQGKLPKMIDFASGSGHFLTTYMKEMQHQIQRLNPLNYSLQPTIQGNIINWQKSYNEYRWASNYVYGIEIDYRLVKTAKIDTYLNGDGDANIIHANALNDFKDLKGGLPLSEYQNNGTTDKEFNILVSNPPYSVEDFLQNININDFPVLKPLLKKAKNSKKIELLFVERATQLLKDNGYIAIILPSAFLRRNSKLDNKSRQLFLDDFNIKSITALPNCTFQATGTRTILILAKKRINGEIININNQINSALEDNDLNATIDGHLHAIEDWINATSINITNWNKKTKSTKNKLIKRIATYIMNHHKIAVIQPASNKNDDKKDFLGYDFSSSRGNEGIHPLAKGYTIGQLSCLYDNSNTRNNFLDYVNRQIFTSKESNPNIEIPSKVKGLVHIRTLTDLMPIKNSKKFNTVNLNASSQALGYSSFKNTVSLNDVATIVPGTSIKKSDTKRGNYDVIAGGIKRAYTIDHPNRSANTITISESGASAGYIGYQTQPFFASDCFTIKANPDNLYSTKELFYLLKDKQKQIINTASGSAQSHVYPDNVLYFQLPMLNKKQHIQLLKSINNKLNKIDEANYYINNFKNKIKDLSNNAYNNSVKYKIDNLEKKDYLKVVHGVPVPKEYGYVPRIITTNHFYPRIQDINNNTINLSTSKQISDKVYHLLPNRDITKNDIFISIDATVGLVGMIPYHLPKNSTITLNRHAVMISIRDTNKILPEFIMIELNSNQFRQHLKALSSGNEQDGVNKDDIKSCGITIPELSIQKNYCQRFNNLKQDIKNIRLKIKNLLNTDSLNIIQ